jgi:hypothetical protein
MKKLTLLSAFLGIFAGFLISPAFAENDLPPGTSLIECEKQSVRLSVRTEDTGKKIRIWEKCKENDTGCRIRFCNNTSKNSENPYWLKDDCNKYCVGFQEPIPFGKNEIKSITGESGTDLAMNYVSMIYKIGASLLGLIAILVIVVSGVQMIAGGVEESNYTEAKDRIIQALLSLAVLFSSALILRTVNPDFFV